jgi:hypothetical protein
MKVLLILPADENIRVTQERPRAPKRAMLRFSVLLLTIVAAAVLIWLPRIPQNLAYHNFADQRGWLGIPNAMDVASNLPLVVIGTVGLALCRRTRQTELCRMKAMLFCAVALTGFGSAYYHWQPTNATLVWDRLPLAAMFMTFFAVLIADRVSLQAGRRLFWPLVGVGVVSVVQWWWSERHGVGDLRLYGVVQFLPMLLLPVMVATQPGRFTRNREVWWVLGFYALAKVCEAGDAAVFGWTHCISGHTLKHLCAGVAAWCMVRMLTNKVVAAGPGELPTLAQTEGAIG